MICIGFWSKANDPTKEVDTNWIDSDKEWILMYIKGLLYDHVALESYEMGYSYCRFDANCPFLQEPKEMGACTLTDGTYCWPEGYIHYIEKHHVRPPLDFLNFIKNQFSTAKTTKNTELQLFDMESKSMQPIPRATKAWLTAFTTL